MAGLFSKDAGAVGGGSFPVVGKEALENFQSLEKRREKNARYELATGGRGG
jgi:hypothetical protein